MPSRGFAKFGTLNPELTPLKDRIDFLLSRFPSLYLLVEQHREWVNWDKRVYLSFIRRGDVVLDVGANVGAHTVFFSHLVGKRGRVISFEPVPANIASLRSLLRRRQRFKNVTIIPAAVGNPIAGQRTAKLLIPGGDLTQSSLRAQSAGSWSSACEVEEVESAFTSIDQNQEVSSLRRLDFIKLDVEGGELDVLRGAAAAIARHRPIIYCEIFENWARSFGYGPRDLIDFVHSLGYRVARLISGGIPRALSLDRPLSDDWFSVSSDILFLLDEHRDLTSRFDKRYL